MPSSIPSDYIARGVPYGPDDGTVAPWVSFACLPFAPEIVLPTIRNFLDQYPELARNHGSTSAINPTFPAEDGGQRGWISPIRYALNQAPVVIMLENYRTGLIWKLMHSRPRIVRGLQRAGFEGGGSWMNNFSTPGLEEMS